VQPAAFAAALLIPALALAGFVAAGFNHNPNLPAFATEQRALLVNWRGTLLLTFFALLAVTLLARWLRSRIGGTYQLRLSSGRVVTAPVGRSILEALRDEGIPHASVCGGRARCTTCRVRVGDGLAKLAAPAPLEAQALARIDAPPNVRLACQARPRSDVAVAPLLPPGAGPATARRPGAPQGRERPVVAMFVDLRESTKLCESRLPYDAVFIMNQFFAEMHDALRATNGYYAQFRGDGLLALYGLDSDLPRACRDALRGAAEMQARIERLSASLADELAEPMRIGIGMHAGVAIVGTMGPPAEPIHSAIGDNINIAARFEGMTKIYRCVLVVSAETLRQAGIDPKEAPLHHVRVRGRNERVDVYAIADPRALF
jgi:adenylate cyclase